MYIDISGVFSKDNELHLRLAFYMEKISKNLEYSEI